jgi:hypothetical protein
MHEGASVVFGFIPLWPLNAATTETGKTRGKSYLLDDGCHHPGCRSPAQYFMEFSLTLPVTTDRLSLVKIPPHGC